MIVPFKRLPAIRMSSMNDLIASARLGLASKVSEMLLPRCVAEVSAAVDVIESDGTMRVRVSASCLGKNRHGEATIEWNAPLANTTELIADLCARVVGVRDSSPLAEPCGVLVEAIRAKR